MPGAMALRRMDILGDVVQYEAIYRLCYVRGPEGIIIALAEELRRPIVKPG
jgi:hypothetical protein